MRRQLVMAVALALVLGLLIMLVVRCGPQRSNASTLRPGTPTKSVQVKGTPSPIRPLSGTPAGRPTEVSIGAPGTEAAPTPITVGPILPAPTQPVTPTLAPAAPTATTAPAASSQPTTPSSSSARRTYTVQRGDTLTKIARQFGTTVDAIVRANNIKDRNKIYVGQKLIIP